MYGFWKGSESRQKCSAIELSSYICDLGRWIIRIQLCLSLPWCNIGPDYLGPTVVQISWPYSILSLPNSGPDFSWPNCSPDYHAAIVVQIVSAKQ